MQFIRLKPGINEKLPANRILFILFILSACARLSCVSAIDAQSAAQNSSKRRARRLRIIGVGALALGTAAAGLVYGMGKRNADLRNDASMQGFNRAEQRQMGQLYGKSGLLIDEWSEDLRQPGTQAVLIALASVLTSVGCFYFARLSEVEEESISEGNGAPRA